MSPLQSRYECNRLHALCYTVRSDQVVAALDADPGSRMMGYRSDVAGLEILPLLRAPDVALELPGSKSISNRYLLLAALASGTSRLERLLVADDTEAMLDCIDALGARVSLDAAHGVAEITGIDGKVPPHGEAFARQSGTTARFVAPVLALGSGEWRLDGATQLRARPMGDLFSALEHVGVKIEAEGLAGSLPARIHGPIRQSRTSVSGSVSSQFLSGLLLASPLVAGGFEIEVTTNLVSRPYVEMTIEAMAQFGVQVHTDHNRYVVVPTTYRAADLGIEPDASGASYFFAAAVVSGGRVRINGLGIPSMQGDVAFVDVLEQMGATVEREQHAITVSAGTRLQGVDVDMADYSDMVPTLAVVASLADSPTHIRGVGFIRNKESDRIAAVVNELRRCGVDAREEQDGLAVNPRSVHGALVQTYADHRIAMAFSVLGLVVPGVRIEDPRCVDKTFPQFYEVLERLRG